jgi:hypothetical protein
MTGAGVVQTSSPIGFETLYAGYRWDNPAPQMYYVRNRFLLPQVGTWNKRDPLGYVDGMGLYWVVRTVFGVDPEGTTFGMCPDSKSQLILSTHLQYSCKCGWIDWSHAGGNDDKVPGAALSDLKAFIEQIRELAKLPPGKQGKVCYGTSQQKLLAKKHIMVVTGTKMCFYVATGLSAREIECAAFEMFARVQIRYEYHQHEFEALAELFSIGIFPTNNSGFSPEDLPSDVLLFRRALGNLSVQDVKNICGPVIEDKTKNLGLCAGFDWNSKLTSWNPTPCVAAGTLCDGLGETGILEFPKAVARPRCELSGEGPVWRSTGESYTGVETVELRTSP